MSRRFKRKYGVNGQLPHVGNASVRLIAGLFIVMLGLLFLVSSLHVFDSFNPMRYFMAIAFVAIGAAIVIERKNERSWQWGLAWIAAGVWTFAYQRRWIDVGFLEVVVPVLMLVGGAYLVRRALNENYEDPGQNPGQDSSQNPGQSSTSSNSTFGTSTGNAGTGSTFGMGGNSRRVVHGVGVLSSSEQKPAALERADLFALMGGVKLDLFDTQLVNNTAVIHVAACMGGIEICAPSEWIITSRVLPIMGAFIDKRRPAASIPSPDQAKTLIIDGFVLMGGVEIKN